MMRAKIDRFCKAIYPVNVKNEFFFNFIIFRDESILPRVFTLPHAPL